MNEIHPEVHFQFLFNKESLAGKIKQGNIILFAALGKG